MKTDYLIIGAGAMGMAFADVILTESAATVTLVDRRDRPGGHWNDAYPHVRLHQPSSFYGVNSRQLGADAIDTTGWNRGLFELASGSEVVAYYDQVLRQQMLPTGRLHWLPRCDYQPDGTIQSRVTGRRTRVEATRRTVDATYMNVVVPAMRKPPYAVDDGVHCIAPNELANVQGLPDRWVIVGAGKTGMDACLWLLAHDVDPDRITWIMPRDSWMLDRANIQPGPEFLEQSLEWIAGQTEAAAEATSVAELFVDLEDRGVLHRLDPTMTPTMYRCATVTTDELDQLRRITDIVRRGRVRRISTGTIELDVSTLRTSTNTVHVDCTADGLARRPSRPIFDDDRLTLQSIRTCQQVFSAAMIAHVELRADLSDNERNDLCGPVPHPDSATDWIRCTLASGTNSAKWSADPELTAWLQASRLDAFSRSPETLASATPAALASATRMFAAAEASLTNLERLAAEADAAGV